MKKLLPLLLLVSCAHPYNKRVTFVDHSDEAPMVVCFQRPGDELECLRGKEFIELLIQHLSEDDIEEIRLRAPDKTGDE